MTPFSTSRLAAMPRPGRRSTATLLFVVSTFGLAACGSSGDGTIPEGDSEALLATLTQIQGNVEDGDCTSARTDASQLVSQIDLLPKAVGTETKGQLFDAAKNLENLIDDPAKCEKPDDETTTETGATGFFGEGG